MYYVPASAQPSSQPFGARQWLTWVFGTIAGALLGSGLGLALVIVGVIPFLEQVPTLMAPCGCSLAFGSLFASMVVGVALVHWLLFLRGSLPLLKWLGMSIVGFVVAAPFGIPALLGMFVVGGAMIGVGQWRLLRHLLVSSRAWIICSSLGWVLGMVVGVLSYGILGSRDRELVPVVLALLIGWGCYGLATGWARSRMRWQGQAELDMLPSMVALAPSVVSALENGDQQLAPESMG
jgi:hypothetical protein